MENTVERRDSGSVSLPYCVSVYGDTWSDHATFPEALNAVKKLCRPYWGWGVVHIHNLDRVDVDTNGLTEDEEEQLTEFRCEAEQARKKEHEEEHCK